LPSSISRLLVIWLCVFLMSVLGCGGAPPDGGPPAARETARPAVETAAPGTSGNDPNRSTPETAPAAGQDAPVPLDLPSGPVTDRTPDRETVPAAGSAPSGTVDPARPAGVPAGPAAGAPADAGRVVLHISRDFGRTVLFSREVELRPGDTVLAVLSRNVTVQTAYGGAFVNGIEGLVSGYTGRTGVREQRDWLYWVNGVAAAQGPAQYRPRPGDFIWWDYQDWGAGQMANAVVGAFPRPFVTGPGREKGGALVIHAPGREGEAARLKDALEKHGVSPAVEVAPLENSPVERREKPALIVGTWEELSGVKILARFNDQGPRSGLHLRLAPGEVVRLGPDGRETGRHGAKTGALWALGNGPGDPAPLFVVTGTDAAGLAAAVELLTRNEFPLRGAFAVVVTPGGAFPVP